MCIQQALANSVVPEADTLHVAAGDAHPIEVGRTAAQWLIQSPQEELMSRADHMVGLLWQPGVCVWEQVMHHVGETPRDDKV